MMTSQHHSIQLSWSHQSCICRLRDERESKIDQRCYYLALEVLRKETKLLMLKSKFGTVFLWRQWAGILQDVNYVENYVWTWDESVMERFRRVNKGLAHGYCQYKKFRVLTRVWNWYWGGLWNWRRVYCGFRRFLCNYNWGQGKCAIWATTLTLMSTS